MKEWAILFDPNGNGRERRKLLVLSRGGRPFLYLPSTRAAALVALSFYPAQGRFARLARNAVAISLRLGLPLPFPRRELTFNPDAPCVQVFSELGKESPGGFTSFGVLSGNPNASGQRHVMILFDGNEAPFAVVKVGLGAEAEQLIELETAALRALPEGLPGAVQIKGTWQEEGVSMLALPFIRGASPSSDDFQELERLSTSWLDHGRTATLESLPGWSALREVGWEAKLQCLLPSNAGMVSVRSPIAHGDLAPWNIKSDNGRWTVIDWERGTLRGVPGWDWFHYILQPAVLVEKCNASAIAERACSMLTSDGFQRYVEAAQIKGLERALLLAYLAYCTEVIRQGEGREALVEAREILSRAWGVAG